MVRTLATTGRYASVVGVEPGFRLSREPTLPFWELPAVGTESITRASVLRSGAVAVELASWLHADRRRVFHGHSRIGLLVGLWLTWWGASRVVISVHCFGHQRWFYRWVHAMAGERVRWLSPAMKLHYGVGGRDWHGCVANAVEARCFAAAPAACSPPRGEGHLRVGGAGFLIERKGWHVLLDAMLRLTDAERARLSFIHAGGCDGSPASATYAENLFQRAAASELAPCVRWLGDVPSIRGLLAEIDLLVVPSFDEPFGLVILEAWAAGVPVLASDSGGPRDLIRPGVNGWLFPTGDAAALASALRMRLNSASSERVRPVLPARHSAAAAHAAWAAIYREVVDGGAVI